VQRSREGQGPSFQGTGTATEQSTSNSYGARESINDQFRSNTLVSAAIVVAALYVGRDILLPFALAILLSFLLAPLVERLEKWKFGRIPAVLTVVTVAFLSFSVLAFVLAHQVYDLAYKLPDYQENILAKAQSFQGDGTGVLGRLTKSVGEMRAKLSIALVKRPLMYRQTQRVSPTTWGAMFCRKKKQSR
jgi:predicted PurR-regulated permease PerM